MKRSVARMLTQVATVYGRHATTGKYTEQLRTGLACSLQAVNRRGLGPPGAPQRSEPAADGHLYWDPAYEMPEFAQVTVDAFGATRWVVVATTIWPEIAPGNVIVYRHCDVVRA
jgi:hypothetical protein